jgi:hypothetical protein
MIINANIQYQLLSLDAKQQYSKIAVNLIFLPSHEANVIACNHSNSSDSRINNILSEL